MREYRAILFVLLVALFSEHRGVLSRDLRDTDGTDPHHRHLDAYAVPKKSQKAAVDWVAKGQDDLRATLEVMRRQTSAKNAILFIGDGMGVATLTAARFYKAQKTGATITDTSLSWETFPFTGMIETYNTDLQTPDSAGTATAFLCGEKTREGMLGVNQDVPRGDCSMVEGNEIKSFLHYGMEDAGKWAGVVTTTTLTHATPAAVYAHSPDRDWQDDSAVLEAGEDPETCLDIARQLVEMEDNKQIRVLLGGGRRHLMPNTTFDPEYNTKGFRQDGRDLRQEWLNTRSAMGNARYVENKTDFDNIDIANTDYLMGVFEFYHMKYEADRLEETGDVWTEPSLAEMVKTAIDVLKKGPSGFTLLVEGGRIDHAHHDNNAHRALQDTLALEAAVAVAVRETSEEDTLIMVTADHSHAFSMGGYPDIDNDILGIAIDQYEVINIANDDKPWLTLGYANGPGFYNHRTSDGDLANEIPRINLTGTVTTGKDFLQDAGAPLWSETHGGEDVAIYARGPMSHLLTGQHEQSYIAHVAMYSMCIGWNKELCSNPPKLPECEISGSASLRTSHVSILALLFLTFVLSRWNCRAA